MKTCKICIALLIKDKHHFKKNHQGASALMLAKTPLAQIQKETQYLGG